MSRRSGDRVAFAAGAGAAAITLALSACQSGSNTDIGCTLPRQSTLAPTPLGLLRDARLDPIGGDRYVLIGTDGQSVRWAPVSADGLLGAEQALALPATSKRAVYGLAGANAPADRVLAGYVTAASNGTDDELRFLVAPADGSGAPTEASFMVSFPGGLVAEGSDPLPFAFASSRAGLAAGLVWVDRPSGQVLYTALSGQGDSVATPVAIDAHAADVKCLTFGAGTGDLTVEYLHDDGGMSETAGQTPSSATWLSVAATESGSPSGSYSLTLPSDRHPTSCPVATPTAGGWAVAWQDVSGSWLSLLIRSVDGGALDFVQSYPFAPASDFGGADVQPPLVALAPFGGDLGVLAVRTTGPELWRVDGFGVRRPGALVFPSTAGDIGAVSAIPSGPGLLVTYADYEDASSADAMTSGRRLLVNATCY